LASQPFRSAFWENVAACILYFAAALLGLHFAGLHGNVSPFWPAAGVGIGVLLIGGFRLVPGIALGAFLANAITSISLPAAACITTGNTVAAILGVMLFRFTARQPVLRPFADPAGWVIAAVFSPVLAAAGGVATLWLFGEIKASMLTHLALTWWAGDGIGILVTAPAIYGIYEALRERRWPRMGTVIYAVVFACIAAGVCWWVFFQPQGGAYLFLLFAVLLLAAIWFDGMSIHLACFGMVMFCVFAIGMGHSPIPMQEITRAC